MILEKQPKTFVIALKDHPVSKAQLRDCLDSAEKFDWKVEVCWGVDGRYISDQTWKNEEIFVRTDKPTMHRAGVRGCFLSHWSLWKKCIELNEPIIILEHDAVIQKKWELIELGDSIVKLHRHYAGKKVKYDVDSGNWSKSGHAYCISPFHAKILIEFVRRVGAYEVDIIMGDKVIPIRHLTPSWVERQNSYSTTTNI
jgi:glycosyl transferase family 25